MAQPLSPSQIVYELFLKPLLGSLLSLLSGLLLLAVVIRLRSWHVRRQQRQELQKLKQQILHDKQQQQQQTSDTKNENDNSNGTRNTAAVVGTTVAFFHPYCSGGGGGERVLWKIIQALGDLYMQGIQIEQVVIYTVDPYREGYTAEITKHVQERFATTFSKEMPLHFVHLDKYAHFLKPSPRFSMLVESFQTMRLAFMALATSPVPDVYVDTTGCAFTYLVATVLFGCRVVAYVHYPTISTDMLQLVWQRRKTAYTNTNDNNDDENNDDTSNRMSFLTSSIKLVYYLLFAILYGMVGSLASLVMVNSTWTCNHIQSLWKIAAWRKNILIVFPPCQVSDAAKKATVETVTKKPTNSFYERSTTSEEEERPKEEAKSDTTQQQQQQQQQEQRQPFILSIGQFRPEKDHALQLEAFVLMLQQHPELRKRPKQQQQQNNNNCVQLVLAGSCRNQEDQKRLQALVAHAGRLNLSEMVRFVVNEPYDVIWKWLKQSSVGIHTMWNEHFGIGIVEMMAAGLIVIAHDSGGPKSDIVVPPSATSKSLHQICRSSSSSSRAATGGSLSLNDQGVGFLATTREEYAEAMYQALTLDQTHADALRQRAQTSAQRFSDEAFDASFKKAILESRILKR